MKKKEGKSRKRTRKGSNAENVKREMSDEELLPLRLKNKINKQKTRSNVS